MTPETIVFDPTPCDFPKPRLPPLPQGPACFSIGGVRKNPATTSGAFRDFARGRYALLEAYRRSGVDAQSAILAPSYHCRTMVDPALALGAEAILYPLSEQLVPDLAAIDRMHRQSTRPVRAVLATHFFGIPQDFGDLARWCKDLGIVLVEDCSHAMFTRDHRPHAIGCFGNFVVSSPYKFVASTDGGLLYARDAASLAGCTPRQPSWRNEIRAVLRTLGSLNAPRFAAPEGEGADAELAAVVRAPIVPGREVRAPQGLSDDYRPEHEDLASLRWSRLLHRHVDPECVADARRRRYGQWSEATTGLAACRPFAATLPDGCVPYMFPLVIERPQSHFYWLKRLGVPIWRWDSIVGSSCATANRYRLSLLHLPCHPSIDDVGMDWLTSTVRKIMLDGVGREST